MVSKALAGDFAEAQKEHFRLWNLFKGLFIETNPIPVKAALEMLGIIKGKLRLPMSELSSANGEKVQAILKETGLL